MGRERQPDKRPPPATPATPGRHFPRSQRFPTSTPYSTHYYDYWATNPLGVESHFWVGLDGELEQYVDTVIRADANYRANRWLDGGTYKGAISIETENSRVAVNAYYQRGDHAAIDSDPWTAAQLATMQRLHAWLADTHPTIERRRATGPFGTGLGYHSMWGTGPTDWIPNSSRGKTCPGGARIDQWNRVLLPAFTSSTTNPPTSGGLTMSDIDQIVQRLERIEQNVAHRAIAVRDPRDKKVWVITPDGTRYHLPNPKNLPADVLTFLGYTKAGGKGNVHDITPAGLDAIPIRPA